MDFGKLLSVAQRNESNKQAAAYYPSKFTPPKKESRQSKVLSQNIKKFLAKKEEEEKRKTIEEQKKKQNLLALRDHKAQSRINKHLKVCKSANKSVLDDAVDNENTAITMAGPSQPDEDDYGYVSQEASAFYNKLMNKYNNMPAEKPLFNCSGKKTVKDIASTKDRVKQALKQQEIEDSQGHRRKRKSSGVSKDCEHDSESEVFVDEKRDNEKESKPEKLKVKKKPMPPPMDFLQLLKLAEKKQHEPIVVEVKPKQEEPERLLTKKQMKEERYRSSDSSSSRSTATVNGSKLSKPKTSESEVSNGSKKLPADKQIPHKPSQVVASKKPVSRLPDKNNSEKNNSEKNNSNVKNTQQKSKDKESLSEERRKLEIERRKLEEMRRSIEEEKRKLSAIKEKNVVEQKSLSAQTNKAPNKIGNPSIREVPKGNGMKRPDVMSTNHAKSRLSQAGDFKSPNRRPILEKDRRPTFPSKRRAIIDDDDDDEYDSELDDFIDDGPEEGRADYSKYISEIFGYDKSKYRNIDEDDAAMESNFAQQLKEEFVSTKIGIMEDLEDIRMEAREKKRKALSKKKRKI